MDVLYKGHRITLVVSKKNDEIHGQIDWRYSASANRVYTVPTLQGPPDVRVRTLAEATKIVLQECKAWVDARVEAEASMESILENDSTVEVFVEEGLREEARNA